MRLSQMRLSQHTTTAVSKDAPGAGGSQSILRKSSRRILLNNLMGRRTQHDNTKTIDLLQCVISNLLPRRINETAYITSGCDGPLALEGPRAVALKQYGCSYSRLNLQFTGALSGPSSPYNRTKRTYQACYSLLARGPRTSAWWICSLAGSPGRLGAQFGGC